jgi:putative PIN family toxin of toxin-antitoxin system
MAKKKRLKIILDTNWYVSASINRTSRRRLYDLLINENLTIFYSRELLAEYESVISRKKFEKFIRQEQVSRFIGLVLTRLKPVEIRTLIRLSRDTKESNINII